MLQSKRIEITFVGDFVQSIGVLLASVAIYVCERVLTNPSTIEKVKIIDPILTFIFALLVIWTTIKITRDCIQVLMEGLPSNFEYEEFINNLKAVQGVIEIHDVHVWSLSIGKAFLIEN